MEIRHVYGNALKLAIPLQKVVYTLVDGQTQKTKSDFYPNSKYPTLIILRGIGPIHYDFFASVNGNVATMVDDATIQVGTYSVEVIAHDENEEQVRYKVNGILKVVDASKDAGIEAGIEFDGRKSNFGAQGGSAIMYLIACSSFGSLYDCYAETDCTIYRDSEFAKEGHDETGVIGVYDF